jgi:uncharacterized RmlC-like cupin family protein
MTYLSNAISRLAVLSARLSDIFGVPTGVPRVPISSSRTGISVVAREGEWVETSARSYLFSSLMLE